jgi:hypothetical protein
LNGCAKPTEAQQTAIRTGAAFRDASLEAKACRAEVRERPKYASIVVHYAKLETGQFSLEQLSDKRIPTPEEARLVALYYDDIGVCLSNYDKVVAANRPTAFTIIKENRNKQAQTTVRLVQRRISWGEAAQQYQSATSDMNAKSEEENRQWLSDL